MKIAGNLSSVGTADLAVYLIHPPTGNILINAHYPQDLPLRCKIIRQLGFNSTDTKILLISHAHGDHDAAVGLIKKETGARLMVMAPDVAQVESTATGRPGAKVDRVLDDGDTVELGGSTLTARLTPGHTPGCTTWTMRVSDGGRTLDAVIIGSPKVNAGFIPVSNKKYPQIAEDYVRCFDVLHQLPANVFLGAHGGYFGLKEKFAAMKPGGPNPFINPAGSTTYVGTKEAAFRQKWERQTLNPGSPTP